MAPARPACRRRPDRFPVRKNLTEILRQIERHCRRGRRASDRMLAASHPDDAGGGFRCGGAGTAGRSNFCRSSGTYIRTASYWNASSCGRSYKSTDLMERKNINK